MSNTGHNHVDPGEIKPIVLTALRKLGESADVALSSKARDALTERIRQMLRDSFWPASASKSSTDELERLRLENRGMRSRIESLELENAHFNNTLEVLRQQLSSSYSLETEQFVTMTDAVHLGVMQATQRILQAMP